MAIIDVQEIWDRDGGFDVFKATRDYTRTWRVRTDSAQDGPTTILQDPDSGLPSMRDTYADPNGIVDMGSIVQRFRVKQDQDDPNTWLVTAIYSSAAMDVQQRAATEEDPLSRPPIINWTFQKYQKPALTDINGAPIRNSAGAWFTPVPEIDDSRPVLTIERNEATLNTQNLIDYQDAVDTDNPWGFGTGTAKIAITAQSQYENGMFYWKVVYTIEFRRDGWDLHIVDAGFYELDANNNPVGIPDRSGQQLAEPVLLNGAGKRRAGNDPNPYYVVDYTVYKQLPYGPLGLPTSLG